MILFFIRSFNDVDHIVPIVYKMAGTGEEKVHVLCQNPSYDIEGDFRLKFLREKFGNVEIAYVYSYAGFGDMPRGEPADEAWAKKLYESLNASVAVFDYVIDSGLFVTGPLLKAAAQMHIPTIGVPPGLPILSEGYTPDAVFFKKEVCTELNYNIVPHQIDADYRVKQGFSPERIRVLGSARYCKEWRDVINSIVPPDLLPGEKKEGALKVIYMERGADLHGEYKEVIADTIARVSLLDFVHLVIKPHTRARTQHFSDAPEFDRFTSEASSINLIRWADVVIGTNSSILIEALMQDKILLYPRYFHADNMVFHDMNACWSVYGPQELEKALEEIRSGHFERPYSRENVSALFEKIVYGGKKDRDVLEEYARFIRKIENKTVTAQEPGLSNEI